MQLTHILRALRAVMMREMAKFVQQRGRLLAALVRPLIWLAVFAAGFYNVFGVSIIPPYKTYITYQVYIVPGLLGMILLFHGMQSSLSMVYDREMGVMRLLLTAPLPRWVLLACKLVAGTALSVITCYVFLAVCIAFDVTFDPIDWLAVLPALIVCGLMLGALWLFLSVYIRQVENFAGAMNFVMFPMFFFSSALYPLWRLREGGSELLYYVSLANPFTYAVELIRFALYGAFDPVAALVVAGATVLFFLLAVIGYDPQRGMLRRTRAGAAGVTNYLMNVPLRSSENACCNSACVFITIGPCQATGSAIGLPETRRKRMPSSPACTVTSSPRSNTTSERLPVCSRTTVSSPPSVFSVSTPNGCDAARKLPEPSNT